MRLIIPPIKQKTNRITIFAQHKHYDIIKIVNLDTKIRWSWGLALSLVIVAIPMFGWKLWFSFEGLSTFDALTVALAKIGAFGGMAMFAWSLILSARYTFYERLFGGLDKVYLAHRFLGTASVVLLFLHPLALSLRGAGSDPLQALSLWVNFRSVAIMLGAVSLYGLIALVVWSITTKKSHETFIKVHRLLGFFFVFGAIHGFLIGRTIAASPLLYWYLLILSFLAVWSFVTYSLLGDILHRPLPYRVTKVKKLPHKILEISLKPERRLIRFQPGQFVYAAFPKLGWQYHPFSVASAKHESTLRLSVRQVGDFTETMKQLKVGDQAKLKGPYGGFTFQERPRRKQLWIAGGIGVTPFLSAARSLRHSNESGQVEMIYATADQQPYGYAELEKIKNHNTGFHVTMFHQDTHGFVSLRLLQEHFGDLADRDIYVCGPPPMLHSLLAEAEELGLTHKLHYEAFSF